MTRVVKYLVISHGGLHSTGDPSEAWFPTLRQAEDEVRWRLGVKKLHKKGRGIQGAYFPSPRVWTHDGCQWTALHAYTFKAVTASHPDFARSGGITLYTVERGTAVASAGSG